MSLHDTPLTINPGAGATTVAGVTDADDDGPSAASQALYAPGNDAAPRAAGPEPVARTQDTLAARLRAKAAELNNRTAKFAVPPLDVWGQDLVVEVRHLELKEMPDLRLIAEATQRVLFRNEQGQLEEIPGGWEGVGRIMELTDAGDVTVGQIITAVCGSREAVHTLAVEVVAWIMGRTGKHEQALGE
jgi:hypothetical protein